MRHQKAEACESVVIHKSAVEEAKKAMPEAGGIDSLGRFFKVLSDPTRLSILYALAGQELCVCDLSVTLDMSQSAVSHQLALLKQARLVASRRDGKVIFYRLDDDHVHAITQMARVHLEEVRTF